MAKKFISNGLLLLLIATVFYFGLFFILNKIKVSGHSMIHSLNPDLVWEGGNSYLRFRDYDRNTHYDVLVMGSSHAYRGFDPRIFEKNGLHMFNLGSSSQSIVDTEVLLKHLVDPAHVEMIIFEVFPLTFVEDGYESTAILVANLPQDDIALELLKNRCDIKAFNMWTQRTMRKLEDGPQYTTDDYIGNGFCENTDSITSKPAFLEKQTFDVKEESIRAFENLIRYVKKNNIKAVFVTQPMPKGTDRHVFDTFNDFMNQYVDKEGIFYLDYSQMDLDAYHHFFDYSHLNQAGVNIFNERLLKDLALENHLPE